MSVQLTVQGVISDVCDSSKILNVIAFSKIVAKETEKEELFGTSAAIPNLLSSAENALASHPTAHTSEKCNWNFGTASVCLLGKRRQRKNKLKRKGK